MPFVAKKKKRYKYLFYLQDLIEVRITFSLKQFLVCPRQRNVNIPFLDLISI
jgi:hypothetical protein